MTSRSSSTRHSSQTASLSMASSMMWAFPSPAIALLSSISHVQEGSYTVLYNSYRSCELLSMQNIPLWAMLIIWASRVILSSEAFSLAWAALLLSNFVSPLWFIEEMEIYALPCRSQMVLWLRSNEKGSLNTVYRLAESVDWWSISLKWFLTALTIDGNGLAIFLDTLGMLTARLLWTRSLP